MWCQLAQLVRKAVRLGKDRNEFHYWVEGWYEQAYIPGRRLEKRLRFQIVRREIGADLVPKRDALGLHLKSPPGCAQVGPGIEMPGRQYPEPSDLTCRAELI